MKKNSLISGIVASTVVFAGGYFISRLIRKYIDKGYIHGPGLSHLFLLLLFFFCIGWLVRGIIKRKDKNLGLFWMGSAGMNFCFIVLPIAYLFTTLNRDSDIKNEIPGQSITIKKDTLSSGAVILNQDGDTLLYRKGNTTVIDRTEQLDYETMKIKNKKVE
jgi:hypothetical protein